MKKLLVMLVLCLAAVLAGCTLDETRAEHGRRLLQITDVQLRMLVEDWEEFWLYDKSTTLSRWHVRVGS